MLKFKELKNKLKEVYTITQNNDIHPCLLAYDETDCINCEDSISEKGERCMQYGFYKIKNLLEDNILPLIRQLQEENINLKRENRRLKKENATLNLNTKILTDFSIDIAKHSAEINKDAIEKSVILYLQQQKNKIKI